TLTRKLREIRLTLALEKQYDKREILELYLNSIYFGHDSFGIARAAQFYFGKEASELSPAQSATLAALVKSPNRYSPFKAADKCRARRDFVLGLMREQGFLTEREYAEAIGEELPSAPCEREGGSAYLTRVSEDFAELFPDAGTEDFRELKIYTFLDPALQSELEKTQADSDFCALVRDNRTHGVKALAASAGTPARLPASVIKPLLVYAPALEENLISPATPILDEETDFSGYRPSNYGGVFHGYVSARYALAHSVNVPAVKILNSLGCERAASYLARMNLPVDREDYSLALALGGMKRGFTLPALADGYATFAGGGIYRPSSTIARVESDGREIYRFRPEETRVFSEDVAALVNDMLSTAVKEGTAKKLRALPFPICAKTGTAGGANGNTDAYTISYTADDTVAVWLGNADNSPVSATGGGAPADVALRVNRALYSDRSPQPPDCSVGVQEVAFDREEYERNRRIVRADPAAPAVATVKERFRSSALPQTTSTRFSRPIIEKPSISVSNGAVSIVLCQTKYYDYVIKRENRGIVSVVYSGKYRERIVDNSVVAGESYVYTVCPFYRDAEGESVTLPAVRVESETAPPPEDWWNE
ncbi:MAG: transglycosylase domain-containing protein, partial [Candidatus Gallimonas sp.]